MIVNGRQLEAKRGELDRAQLAYADLVREVGKSYDQLLAYARNVNAGESGKRQDVARRSGSGPPLSGMPVAGDASTSRRRQ